MQNCHWLFCTYKYDTVFWLFCIYLLTAIELIVPIFYECSRWTWTKITFIVHPKNEFEFSRHQPQMNLYIVSYLEIVLVFFVILIWGQILLSGGGSVTPELRLPSPDSVPFILPICLSLSSVSLPPLFCYNSKRLGFGAMLLYLLLTMPLMKSC